jgi:hypothetical protein
MDWIEGDIEVVSVQAPVGGGARRPIRGRDWLGSDRLDGRPRGISITAAMRELKVDERRAGYYLSIGERPPAQSGWHERSRSKVAG